MQADSDSFLVVRCLAFVALFAFGCEAASVEPETNPNETNLILNDTMASTPFWSDGIENPQMVDARNVDLAPETEIVAIVVGGQPLAFPLEKLSGMRDHVVNHVVELDGRIVPLTVTYCDMDDCIRVLSSSEKAESLKIATVGRSGGELLLQFGDVRFRQSEREIPLDDIDFERTTFGEWIEAQPESKVYVGRAD